MRVNTNSWNKVRYTLYQPVYDLVGNLFQNYRKKSIAGLHLKPDEKILLVGAGTGLDLPFLRAQKSITAIDITQSMVEQLRDKASELQLKVDARVMDGQKLEFASDSFDVVILHLIVAVIPEPVKCLQEVERVLKPGGRITIMDKFIPPGTRPGLLRRMLNPLTNLLFSSITRDVDALLRQTSLIKTGSQRLKASFHLVSAVKPPKEG